MAGPRRSPRDRRGWDTVPTLQRDERHIEDLDTNGPDHAADAVRYAVTGLLGHVTRVIDM